MQMKAECRICGNEKRNTVYSVKEMEFGTKEEFAYFECAHCGCVQILEIPGNMGSYYPENYFAFKKCDRLAKNSIRIIIRRCLKQKWPNIPTAP